MENWKTVRLGDVCEILNGYAFKSDKYVDSGIRVIRITNVQKGFIEDNSPAFYPITEKENLKDYELYENDLLISLTGNVGRVALLSKEMLPAALNQRVGCIRIRDKNLLISYLFTFLNSDKFESDCIYSARGIAQKNMSTEWLKNYLIPLPPIEVQIKIANNLNTCAKIIKKHNKQLNNFDLLIKSRFIEMFGDPSANPKGWKTVNISEVLHGNTSNGYFAKREEYVADGNVSILGVANIVNTMYSRIEKLPKTNATENDIKKFAVKYGDILFCRSSLVAEGIGKASIVPEQLESTTLFECHVIRLQLDVKKCVPEYLQLLTTTPFFRTQVLAHAKTSTMTTIGQDGILKSNILLPPIELQKDFYNFVQQIDKSKFAVQKSLEKTEILYKSLMQAYFG